MFGLVKKENYAHYDLILLLLRITLGVIFIAYGLQHVIGLEGFITAFEQSFGFVMPAFLATVAAWGELLGGIAVLLGVFTRIGAALIAVTMAVAILFVKLPQVIAEADPALGLTGIWDKDLAYLVIAVVLIITNAGAYSITNQLSSKSKVSEL